MEYKTLSTIWLEIENKPILVVSNENLYVLLQSQVNNGWFMGKPMANNGSYFVMDSTSVVLPGDQEIWSIV